MRTLLALSLFAVPALAFAQPRTEQPAEGSGGAAVVEEATQEDMEAAPTSAEPMTPHLPDETVTGPAPAPEPAPSKLQDFRHRHQVSIRATFGKGYRLAFAYGEHERCGEDPDAPDGLDDTPCYSGSPAFADLDLSFGLTDALELSALIRLGLEAEFTGLGTEPGVTASALEETRPLVLGFGIRVYADPPSRVKVFLGARVLYDLTKAGAEGKQDFAIRAEPGLQIEIIRYVALYIQANATIGFLRWLRFEVDGGGGIQLRVP
jgi:hypothetical protein